MAPEIGDNHAWIDERLDKIPVPVLFLAMQPREGIASVATDNFQGAVMATQHLLDCGRKKIGHISGPLNWWEADERKRGWRETLMRQGWMPQSSIVLKETGHLPAGSRRSFNYLSRFQIWMRSLSPTIKWP